MKGKAERKRYIQVNAEIQRIARIDKKPFLNEHCKEIKEKKKKKKKQNGKDQGSLQENGDIKGPLHARMGTLKTETVTI